MNSWTSESSSPVIRKDRWQHSLFQHFLIGKVILLVEQYTRNTRDVYHELASTAQGPLLLTSGGLLSSEKSLLRQPGGLSGLAPPSAQGVILETVDRVPRGVPSLEPASPSDSLSFSFFPE